MKILHVVPSYYPAHRYGGPIVSVHGLCKGQASHGHEVTVYTTSVDGPNELAVPLASPVNLDGVTVYYFPANQAVSGWSRRLYRSNSMAQAMQQRIAEFDIVHLHSIYLWPTWYAARQARRHAVPYVLSPRGMLVQQLIQRKSAWLKRAWLYLIERHNIRHAAALHYTSQAEQQDATDFVPASVASIVLANGVEQLETMATVERHDDLLVYLGRINWKKGLERLIIALEQVPSARLVIAGNDEEGYSETLQNLIQQKQLNERVELIGFVDTASKQRLLASATVLALCSDNENFGNVVLEAMAVATPVVVTQGVGAAEVVEQYQAGIVCDEASAKIAIAIQSLLDQPNYRAALGVNGAVAVKAQFSWQKIAAQMVNHYKNLLDATPKSN